MSSSSWMVEDVGTGGQTCEAEGRKRMAGQHVAGKSGPCDGTWLRAWVPPKCPAGVGHSACSLQSAKRSLTSHSGGPLPSLRPPVRSGGPRPYVSKPHPRPRRHDVIILGAPDALGGDTRAEGGMRRIKYGSRGGKGSRHIAIWWNTVCSAGMLCNTDAGCAGARRPCMCCKARPAEAPRCRFAAHCNPARLMRRGHILLLGFE